MYKLSNNLQLTLTDNYHSQENLNFQRITLYLGFMYKQIITNI